MVVGSERRRRGYVRVDWNGGIWVSVGIFNGVFDSGVLKGLLGWWGCLVWEVLREHQGGFVELAVVVGLVVLPSR